VNNQEAGDEVRSIIGIGKDRRLPSAEEDEGTLPAIEITVEADEAEPHLSALDAASDDDLLPGGVASVAEAGEADREPAMESDLDLTPGALDKNNDPVRLYLREMGTVPLLKRQDEVAIAKRMERGQVMVLKMLSRSPLVIKDLIEAGKELRQGTLSVKKIVQFDQEELTDEETESKTRDVLRVIGRIEKLYDLARKQAATLDKTAKSNKRVYLRNRNNLARTRVEISQQIRSIDFHASTNRRVLVLLAETGDCAEALEREITKQDRRDEA